MRNTKVKTSWLKTRCAFGLMLFALACLSSSLLETHAQTARRAPAHGAMFTNPVIAGDYPDPSVIRVGRDYYATATSSEWAPQFPLLHSRDLVNWRTIGAVFQRRPAWSVGNYWAPEIAEDKGRFYVYYTARKKDGPLCVAVATANRPQGPYTDKGPLICQDAGSIDAFPIRDENGRRYLVWKYDGNSQQKPTPMYAQPLTEDGTRLTGEMTELIRNTEAWEAQLVEGAYITRRDGYFYMFYSGNACCGRECNYAMGVARSKTLLGKWEKYDGNPILASNDAWKCPGHGTIVSTPDGRDFMLYHAYHPEDSVYVGRQALLDEVTWTSDGWAKINDNRGASAKAPAPLAVRETNTEYRFFDDFTTPALRPGWQWLQNNEPQIRLAQGKLYLQPNPEAKRNTDNALTAVGGHWTTLGDYTATTEIVLDGLLSDDGSNAQVGLSAFGDGENALGIVVRGDANIELYRRERGKHETLKREPRAKLGSGFPVAARNRRMNKPRTVFLRMTATDGNRFQFAVSFDGQKFENFGETVSGNYLPPWDRGVRVALTAGGAPNVTGVFESLRIEPTKVVRSKSRSQEPEVRSQNKRLAPVFILASGS